MCRETAESQVPLGSFLGRVRCARPEPAGRSAQSHLRQSPPVQVSTSADGRERPGSGAAPVSSLAGIVLGHSLSSLSSFMFTLNLLCKAGV